MALGVSVPGSEKRRTHEPRGARRRSGPQPGTCRPNRSGFGDRRRSCRTRGARRCPGTDPAGPCGSRKAASGQRIGGVKAARDVLHVEVELLALVEPARKEAVDVPLRAQPRDRLLVGLDRAQKTPRGLPAGGGRRYLEGSGGTCAGHVPPPAARGRGAGKAAPPPLTCGSRRSPGDDNRRSRVGRGPPKKPPIAGVGGGHGAPAQVNHGLVSSPDPSCGGARQTGPITDQVALGHCPEVTLDCLRSLCLGLTPCLTTA